MPSLTYDERHFISHFDVFTIRDETRDVNGVETEFFYCDVLLIKRDPSGRLVKKYPILTLLLKTDDQGEVISAGPAIGQNYDVLTNGDIFRAVNAVSVLEGVRGKDIIVNIANKLLKEIRSV